MRSPPVLGRAVARAAPRHLHIDLRPSSPVEALAQKLARPRAKQSLATFLRKTLGLSKLEIALLRLAAPLPDGPDALAARVKNVPLADRRDRRRSNARFPAPAACVSTRSTTI